MALAGVGVDIVDIARMERILRRTPHFVDGVFTEEEREHCERTARPAAHYACRFAVREAVLKALGTGFSEGVAFDDVSVSTDASGRPRAVLRGRAEEIARERGVLSVAISLSSTREVAVANAVATTAETAPKAEEDKDPRKELAATFREARSVIDELERVGAGRGSAEVPAASDDAADGHDDVRAPRE